MSTERARFISHGTTPPVGWIYSIVHDGTRYQFQSPMKHGLMRQLRDWYRSKELEWPGDEEMSARIEHHICQYCPKGFCSGGPDRPRVPYLSMSGIRDGTRLILNRLFNRKDFMVPQEEAERRAVVCANCPNNLHGICTGCVGNEFMDIFGWFLRQGRKTQLDSVLDTCSVCGCLLKAKVHVSNETLFELSKHHYPPNCWLHGTPACLPEDPKNEAEEEYQDPTP